MYYFMKALAALLGSLSERSTERIAHAIAFLVFDLFRIRRALVLKNLRLAFGQEKSEAELVRIGRASIYNFALTALEFLRSGRHPIDASIEMRGADLMRAALAKGQGAYILCFHVGNWEAMGAACTKRIIPSHVLVKKVGSGGLDRFVTERRNENAFLTVKRAKKGDGMSAIRDIMGRGEIVGFVMDQARPGEPRLPFFGHPAKTNTSLAAIWRKVPAPIVPAFIHRTGLGRHVLEFFPEVQLEVTADSAADILVHSTQFNAVVESHVRKRPDQYFWMHDRWK